MFDSAYILLIIIIYSIKKLRTITGKRLRKVNQWNLFIFLYSHNFVTDLIMSYLPVRLTVISYL
jgi:hypothetical protein